MAKRTDVKTTEEKVQALTEHAFRKLNRAKSALLTAEKKGEEYVKKHPVKATAIAVGIGVAIGAAIGFLSRGRFFVHAFFF